MVRLFYALVFFGFAITMITPLHVQESALYTVTRLDDPVPDSCLPGDCSLREAIIAANSDPAEDTISFALDGTVELAIAPTGTNDAASGDLNVTNPVVIQGRGAWVTAVDGKHLDRVFSIEGINRPGGCPRYMLEALTVTGGQVTGDGGGVAVWFCGTLDRVILHNNVASNYGGGVYGLEYRITNSAIISNSAGYGGGVVVHGYGLIADNTTISGNSATASGGGLASIGMPELLIGPYVSIKNSTVVYNSSNAGVNGAGIGSHLMSDASPHSISPGNTIVAHNTGGTQCGPLDEGSPSSPNLTTDGSCETTLIGDPQVGPLADNGGNTLTHALGTNSPALDAGTCTAGSDQRGEPRPVDLPGYPNAANGCDIGAYEAQGLPPTAVTLGSWGVAADTRFPIALGLAVTGLVCLIVGWRHGQRFLRTVRE